MIRTFQFLFLAIWLVSACASPASSIPPAPVQTPVPPVSYSQDGEFQIWNFTDRNLTKNDLEHAAETGLIFSAADTMDPLPLELLALAYVVTIGSMYVWQTNGEQITASIQEASDAIAAKISPATLKPGEKTAPQPYSKAGVSFSYTMEQGENGCMHTFNLTNPTSFSSNSFGSCDPQGRKTAWEKFAEAIGRFDEKSAKIILELIPK